MSQQEGKSVYYVPFSVVYAHKSATPPTYHRWTWIWRTGSKKNGRALRALRIQGSGKKDRRTGDTSKIHRRRRFHSRWKGYMLEPRSPRLLRVEAFHLVFKTFCLDTNLQNVFMFITFAFYCRIPSAITPGWSNIQTEYVADKFILIPELQNFHMIYETYVRCKTWTVTEFGSARTVKGMDDVLWLVSFPWLSSPGYLCFSIWQAGYVNVGLRVLNDLQKVKVKVSATGPWVQCCCQVWPFH